LHEDVDQEGLVQLNRAALIIRAVEHERGGAAPQSWSVRIQARFGRTPSGSGLGIRAACAEQAAELNETQIEIAVATKCLLTE
jgi:hypothetical protein